MVRRLVISICLVGAIGLSACGGDARDETAAPSPSASRSARHAGAHPTPTPTPAPEPTESEDTSGEGNDDGVAAGDAPEPVRGLSQGEVYFGVYFLITDDPEDPAIDATVKHLKQQGYIPSYGQLGCDDGASEQLHERADSIGVALYFESEEDARLFASLADPPPVGTAKIKIFCAD